ncbi:hypothetical protein KBC03_06690 [Patescibacteria group bacterium]|nr:hypothetical protein [Patescibacteria group bacterium]
MKVIFGVYVHFFVYKQVLSKNGFFPPIYQAPLTFCPGVVLSPLPQSRTIASGGLAPATFLYLRLTIVALI